MRSVDAGPRGTGKGGRARRTDVSPQRKALYQVGLVLAAIGVCSFLGGFVFAFCSIGCERRDSRDSFAMREPFDTAKVTLPMFGIGMLLSITGSVLMNVGARGVAGSGMKLDPEQARRDLEPLNRMGGGMAKDMLDEAGIDLSGLGGKAAPDAVPPQAPEIKIRCRGCGGLNDEDAKFCKSCGAPL